MIHEQAWDDLHAAQSAGWWLGRPTYNDDKREWTLYAFDPRERPVQGTRKRKWVAMHQTEEGVIREIARALREIGDGRVPRQR